MARLRENFVRGTVENAPLTAGGVVLTSADLVDLPTVADPDIAVLVLDPKKVNGDPEIVYVTDYNGGASPTESATILRGQEGTAAREHPLNTRWVHAPTVDDFDTTPQFQLLDEQDLSGDGTFSFTDIPADYSALMLTGSIRSDDSDETDLIHMRVGNGGVDSGASDYHYFHVLVGGDGGSNSLNHNAAEISFGVCPGNVTVDADAHAYFEARILDYTDTSKRMQVRGTVGGVYSSTRERMYETLGSYDGDSVIDTINIYPSQGTNFKGGSVVRLYGVGGTPLV